jgi:SAM-dependent methyltransferase
MPARNPFLGPQTGGRYRDARPDYHPQAVAVAARLLTLTAPVELAADIGCGTGMSARAVRAVASRVVGLDVSLPMLQAAAPMAGVWYLRAAAERLPVRSRSCDLVTAAAAFHWFDQAATLAEVTRVLRPGGAFVAYTGFFSGRLREEPAFTGWHRDVYLRHFPPPPRNGRFDPVAAEAAGLRLVGEEGFARDFTMTAAQLTDYLLTQSNVTSVLDSGRASLPETRAWLLDQIARLVPAGTAMAQFPGHVWCCRRTG